jgi:hypothetical protein
MNSTLSLHFSFDVGGRFWMVQTPVLSRPTKAVAFLLVISVMISTTIQFASHRNPRKSEKYMWLRGFPPNSYESSPPGCRLGDGETNSHDSPPLQYRCPTVFPLDTAIISNGLVVAQ